MREKNTAPASSQHESKENFTDGFRDVRGRHDQHVGVPFETVHLGQQGVDALRGGEAKRHFSGE